MTTQSLDLNLIPKGISPRLYVSQYDKGQTWTFNIYAGNTAYTIPNGATVTIQGTKPDKTGFQYSCTASGNVVTATEQQQMTVIAGEVPAEIRITNNNEIIATLNFILVVEPAALTDETEISETDLPIIEQAIEMFPHYQEMIDDVSSDIATLSNVRAELGAHNLLDMSKAIIVNNGLSTATINSDGTVYVDGTTTGQSYFPSVPVGTRVIGTLYDLKPNTTYKLSTGIAANAKVALQVFVKSTSSSSWEVLATNTGYAELEFTIPATFYEIWARITLLEGATFSNVTFKPMIRLASDTDPTYQPYAKPNTELTKDDSGLTANAFENGAVNLAEVDANGYTLQGITFIVNADKTISTTGKSTNSTGNKYTSMLACSNVANVQEGKRYKLSGCPTGGGNALYDVLLFCRDSSNAVLLTIQDYGDGVEFTAPSGTVKAEIYIRCYYDVTVTGKVFKPMVTVADMPNSDYAHYVPYCKSNKELTDDVTTLQNNLQKRLNWTSDTDIATTIINNWNSLPKGAPFMLDVYASGHNIVSGYIYNDGNYGFVTATSLGVSSSYLVQKYNGTYSKYKMNYQTM